MQFQFIHITLISSTSLTFSNSFSGKAKTTNLPPFSFPCMINAAPSSPTPSIAYSTFTGLCPFNVKPYKSRSSMSTKVRFAPYTTKSLKPFSPLTNFSTIWVSFLACLDIAMASSERSNLEGEESVSTLLMYCSFARILLLLERLLFLHIVIVLRSLPSLTCNRNKQLMMLLDHITYIHIYIYRFSLI